MALQRTGICHGREEVRPLLYPNDRGDSGPRDGSARVKDRETQMSNGAGPTRMGRYEGQSGASPTYSARSATIGSMLAARLAGITEATSAAAASRMVARESMTGSPGLTPNS